MTDSADNDYYYAHDHLYSPAALVNSAGTVVERYEYDAYGDCNVLNANFADDADGISDYSNPYLFTGRRLDILDTGSLKIQYNRNRYYDSYTARWLTNDPLGITPNPQKPNTFDIKSQYTDGMSLSKNMSSNAAKVTDSRIDIFLSRVAIYQDDCWYWTGGKNLKACGLDVLPV